MIRPAEGPEAGAELPPAFMREGEAFVPAPYASSPWSETQQHGSVMLGLLARAVELFPSEQPVQVTRLTVDLMRAAPMEAVQTRCRAIRTGRWVETLEASLISDGQEYARASAMRFRVHTLDPRPLAGGGEGLRARRDMSQDWSLPRGIRFFASGVQICPGEGVCGPMVWYRMRAPLVAGEPTTGLQRAAAMADFTYGTPFVLRARKDPGFHPDRAFTSINPDTTVNLLRAPMGEWIGLESRLDLGLQGAGVAHATLWDDAGIAGSVTQSILLRPLAAQSRLRSRPAGRGGGGAPSE